MRKKLNIFLRIGITAILILVQIALFSLLLIYFVHWWPIVTVAMYFFSLLVLLFIIRNDDEAGYKIGWIIVVFFLSPAGGLLYLLFGGNRPARKLHYAINREHQANSQLLKQNAEVYHGVETANKRTARLVSYINRTAHAPAYENTFTKYYSFGQDMFADMLVELKKAQHFIFMEYFIIGEGYVWDTVLEVLRKKVKEGVEVRLMYDGTCSISLLPYEYPKQLREYGIQCKEFGPIVPILSTSQNNRDHRKICVVDGKVAFTGGVNLADEYINKKVRFGHWKDTAIKIEGDAVQSFTMMFLQMWNITERQPEDYAKYLTEKQPGFSRKDGYIIPYGDSPFDHENVGEEVYFHILNHAKKYVHIMTPYLILDNEMIDALTRAAKGGIEVQIIMPHIPDKPYAFYLAKTYYEELIAGGVEIYEYTPGFVHAKVFTSDDDTATVGSINLDYRSLYLHFECGVFIYRNPVVRDIEKDFQETLAKCQKVTMTEVRNRSTFVKIYGQVLRIVAPLM